MEILNLTQGSPEWHAVRASRFCSSEAAAMLGQCKKVSRSELLRMKATGAEREYSDWVIKNLFAKGHELEALARPIVEKQIGEELYQVTVKLDFEGLPLLASFDGKTMDEETDFEHKQWNEELAECVRSEELPPTHWPQLEHLLLVGGAKRVRFTVSDGTEKNMVWCWYESVPERRAILIAGWKQFQIDLANYVHVEEVEKPVAAPIDALPALFVQVEGRVVTSNLTAFKEYAAAFIAGINTELQTDQDFADAEKMVKFCDESEKKLDVVKSQALAQTADIEELFRTIDDIREGFRSKRLELDRIVSKRKDTIKLEIVQAGRDALAKHILSLNARIGKPYMPMVHADFVGAIKGKRTIASLKDAVDTTLAHAKIAANETADLISLNIKHLAEHADFAFLFADESQIVLKAADDFQLLVKARIADHKAELERKAAADAAEKVISTAQVAPQITPTPNPKWPFPAKPAKQEAPATPPTLKLGTIAERLGFTLPAEFLKSLGFEGQRVKGACLFNESDYPLICDALQCHIEAAKQKAAA